MLHYIFQTVAFQLLFLIAYDLFLKKETFFNWNRIYLLGTAILSIVLPFIKIESFKTVVPQNFIETLPAIFIGEQNNPLVEKTSNSIPVEVAAISNLEWMLYLGVSVTALLFLIKLTRLLVLTYNNPRRWKGNLLIVKLLNSNAAFSFFHYIFLGEKLEENERVTILNHEAIHAKHKHSVDLLFFEVLRILFWFNPLVYIYQNRMITLHEYIADSKTIKSMDKQDYYKNLLSQVFDTQNMAFTNTFYKQSLIKKRIVMLSKTQSNRILKFKYLVLVPIVLGMLLYTSCEQEASVIEETLSIEELDFTIPIENSITNIDVLYDPFKDEIERQDNFLNNNSNYVKRITIYRDKVTHTLHLKTEDVPEFYNELKDSREGQGGRTYYLGFFYSPKNEKFESEPINPRDYDGRDEVPFVAIDQAPVYPDCESLSNNEERKKCMSKKISEFVRKNFNTKKAVELGLSGRQRISTIFKIDTNGNIVDLQSRAPHPGLGEEAERVIKSLPKMQPGKHNGKNVIVQYALPIIFQVSE